MPTIKTTLISTLKDLNQICLSTGITLSEQDVVSELKSMLEAAIEGKDEDNDFSHHDIIILKQACATSLTGPFEKSLGSLDSLLDDTLKHRNALLIQIVDFLFAYHAVNTSLLDHHKIDPEVLVLCKWIFKVDDVIAFVQSTALKDLIKQVSLSHLFYTNQLQIYLNRRQKDYEEVLIDVAKARESISPKRFEAGEYILTPTMQNKFEIQRKIGKDPFGPRSAPNSARKPMISPRVKSALSQPNTPRPQQAFIENSINLLDIKLDANTPGLENIADDSKSRGSSVATPIIPPLRFTATIALSNRLESLSLDEGKSKEPKRKAKK